MSSLAYTFTIGSGELSNQGLYLLRSIKENTGATKEEIFVFITKKEKSDIEEHVLDEIRQKATLIEGNMPKEGYPHSAAVGALKKASEVSNSEYILLLDTDTLVLDEINIQQGKSADILVTPGTLSRKYWASKEKSDEKFRKLFDEYGFEYPEGETVYSSYGDEEINPYFNAGFVLTKNNDFPERWLSLTKKIHSHLNKNKHFADQISLSLLASDYQKSILDPQFNFFQTLYPYPYEGTKVVHYVETETLYRGIYLSKRIGSGWFAKKVGETGLLEDYRDMNMLKKFFTILNETYFSYNVRVRNRETINYKIRKRLIYLLELTSTKNLARKIANKLLRKQKFSIK